MSGQTLSDLELGNENFRLTLCLHNCYQEYLKNIIDNNQFHEYLLNNMLVNPNIDLNSNIVISDTFIMVDLRGDKFLYNNSSYKDTFKDVFVNNKFFRNDLLPIFFVKDIFSQQNSSFEFINRKISEMSNEIINNIM